MTAPNRVAASLATHRGPNAEVARMLWEHGGRQVRAGSAPPVTAAEIRQMDRDDAATAAVNLEDPDVIATTWRADRRVGVREALLRNSAELLALADNEAAPVDARVAALVAVESTAAGRPSAAGIHERVAPVVTDVEQMRVLAGSSAKVAGRWLADAYASVRLDEEALPEVLDELVAAHGDERAELFSSYAHWKAPGPVPGCVAAWVRQLPELLLSLDRTAGVSDVVATVAGAELGGDVEQWRLFVELADGSPSSIDEILALVAVSQ